MVYNISLTVFLIVFLTTTHFSCGLTIDTRKLCCTLGTNYGKNGLDCATFQPPIAGIQKNDENSCLKIVDVCCKNQIKEAQCNFGVNDAKTGGNCADNGENERKVCCEACQMGIDTQKSGESCQEFSGLGAPYDKLFVSCCEETKTTSTTTTTVTPQTTSVLLKTTLKHEKYPLPSMESLCDSGEVCAQICEPTVDSFICSCNKGFILMEDGVSCRPEKRALKKGDRCEITNPCDQDCLDTGTEIKCSCREGYELAPNKRSCVDVDECATNQHDCTKNEECVNEIGTFSCYELFDSEENTDLDFDAKCRPGYKFNAENHVCDDIDECQVGITCPRPKTCVNTMGSFICEGEDVPQCPPGFFYKAATESCADVDECLTGDNNCNKESQICLNMKGNYTCVDKKSHCPPGFKKNSITQLCEDIDECIENIKVCNVNELCVNEPGGHSCIPSTNKQENSTPLTTYIQKITSTITQFIKPSTEPTIFRPVSCPQGFKYALQLNSCIDVDECAEDAESCDSTQECINTQGSFLCNCRRGFVKDYRTGACIDVNECQMGLHDCTVAERCDNTIGSYQCARITGCGTGYTLNIGNGLCEDNDECKLGTHDCNHLGPNYRCRNLLGSYRCEVVRPSTRFYPTTTKQQQQQVTLSYRNNYLTTNKYVPTPPPSIPVQNYPIISGQLKKCLPGYKMNKNGECEDINECDSNPCLRNEVCLNYNGRYQCLRPKPCKIGYELNEEGQCVDINECSRGTHKCNHSQICKNFVGFYACDCPIGHHLNNLTQQCEDKDECKIYNPCGLEADCINTVGSFQCECRKGFRKSARLICEDVNECDESNLCDHKCVNIWGSYKCACKNGFTLHQDNRTCIDVDECEVFKSNNLCIGNCKNVPGSYVCECPKGYKLGSDGRACLDIDECLENICNSNEICVNLRGSHKCHQVTCPKNYIRDPEHRTRCKRPPTLCDPRDVQCLTLPEQYTYQFLSLVSNLPIYDRYIQLFQIKGPIWPYSRAFFQMTLKDVKCPYGVAKADESYFQKEFRGRNNMQLFLLKSLQGPQEITLEIKMTFSEGENIRGSAVVYLILLVSEYSF